ncbi:MAG: TonB-dependent receptor [Ignavibacteria bacterium]|nr:TonB-dependent receptor [Ignavibacteria bacterium]
MKHLFILFLLSFIHSTFAQTIKGRVIELNSNNPLSNALVYVHKTNIFTSTDDAGEFKLNLVEVTEQSVSLKISLIGYIEETVQIEREDFEKFIIVKLKPKILLSQTIFVDAVVANPEYSALTFNNLSQNEIKQRYTVQDIPQFLSEYPSITSYSENGNGIGYNYINIRGFDQRRISVMINGIPQNDPEDHNVYWVDFPDILESSNNIQIQRGVSSNLIGAPSIGGSINIITSTFSNNREITLKSGIGSYNTRKLMASFSSGLLERKYALSARLSEIKSTGYRENSWVNFFSYFFSVIRFDEKMTNQINIYGAPIEDGLAYTGLPKFAIKDKQLRRKNFSDWYSANDSLTFTVQRRSVETENFNQPHLELLSEYRFNDDLTFNSTLFGVWGKGFFDYDAYWADSSYLRLTSNYGFKLKSNISNALLRAYVDNKQYGWMPKISYKTSVGEFISGLELRLHNSIHWGSVWWAEGLPSGIDQNYRYYEYKGSKNIFSGFLVYRNQFFNNLNLSLESQLVHNRTRLYDEKYLNNDFTIKNTFFNPKVGVNYRFSENFSIYSYWAMVSREPRLKNYYDAAESSGGAEPQFEVKPNGDFDFSKPLVKPERMNNFEFGLNYRFEDLLVRMNLYLMNFKDEIVKKGQLDRFGQPITGNVEKTIHKGVEFELDYKFLKYFNFYSNFSVSKNTIDKGVTYIKYRPSPGSSKIVKGIDISGNPISNFPSVIANFRFSYQSHNMLASLSGQYVGKQYTDIYGDKLKDYLSSYPKFIDYNDNVVPEYFVFNFDLKYDFVDVLSVKKVSLILRVNNIFDRLFATYGIGKEFFPAAERNFYAGFEINL